MTTIPLNLRFSESLMQITDHALLTKHIIPAWLVLARRGRQPVIGEVNSAVQHSLNLAGHQHPDPSRWAKAHHREMMKLRVNGKYRPSSKDKATYKNDNWGKPS